MKSSSSCGPPNVQAVTFVTGSSITSSRIAVGAVPVNGAAVGQRDPDAALGVDGETVGTRAPVSTKGRRAVRPASGS